MTILLPYPLSGNLGDVQPNTSPLDLGFYCGIIILVYPLEIS